MKNKKFTPSVRRLLTAILALVLIAGSFGGCGVIIINGDGDESTQPSAETTLPETELTPETTVPEDTDVGEETDPPVDTSEVPEESITVTPVTFPSRMEDAQERLDLLTDTIDISDFYIILVTASDTVDVIFTEEENPLYAARSNRNTMLHEKYEVNISTIYEEAVDTDRIYSDLSAHVNTESDDEYYLDLLMLPANRVGAFLAKGLLLDMRTLPFYDTKSGNMDGNVGHARYFDIGDGTDVPELIYSLYFNRTMVGKEAENILYSQSLDGTLSFETIVSIASIVTEKSADIAVTGGNNSIFGRLSADLLGIDYIVKDRSGIPSLNMSDENIAQIDKLIESVSKFSYLTFEKEDSTPIGEFIAGKTPFYMGTLSDITALYDKKVEWGILTLPSPKNLGAISDSRPVICLPVTNGRLEQTSLWLSAFNACSGEWIRDQFLAVAIENYLRDNNSCLTMHKILSQKTELDFTLVFSEYYGGLADATYLAAGNALSGETKFSDVWKSLIDTVNKKLSKLP